MRSVTKAVAVEIEGWKKNVRDFTEHGDWMDLGHRKNRNKDEYWSPHADELQLIKLNIYQQTCVSKVKPVNASCHQKMVLAMRLDIAALDMVCLLTCYMFTVFVLRLDVFYEHYQPIHAWEGQKQWCWITGKKRCKNTSSMCKIKMTIEKHENNVGNCIYRGDESSDSRSNSKGWKCQAPCENIVFHCTGVGVK